MYICVDVMLVQSQQGTGESSCNLLPIDCDFITLLKTITLLKKKAGKAVLT